MHNMLNSTRQMAAAHYRQTSSTRDRHRLHPATHRANAVWKPKWLKLRKKDTLGEFKVIQSRRICHQTKGIHVGLYATSYYWLIVTSTSRPYLARFRPYVAKN